MPDCTRIASGNPECGQCGLRRNAHRIASDFERQVQAVLCTRLVEQSFQRLLESSELDQARMHPVGQPAEIGADRCDILSPPSAVGVVGGPKESGNAVKTLNHVVVQLSRNRRAFPVLGR
jgi:hypothetical protein